MTAACSSMLPRPERPLWRWRQMRMWLTAWRRTRVSRCWQHPALNRLCACGRPRARLSIQTWARKLLPTRCAHHPQSLLKATRMPACLPTKYIQAFFIADVQMLHAAIEGCLGFQGSTVAPCACAGPHEGWAQLWCEAESAAAGGHHSEPRAAAGHHVTNSSGWRLQCRRRRR